MVAQLASRLQEFFDDRVGGDLRSIITYQEETHEVMYLRGDVREQYSEEELLAAIDETRFDSLTRPLYESTFADDHGDLTCLVQAYENAVEMNFVLDEGAGVAVGLDSSALEETQGIVADARKILLRQRAAAR